jgi:hypothetical protein
VITEGVNRMSRPSTSNVISVDAVSMWSRRGGRRVTVPVARHRR